MFHLFLLFNGDPGTADDTIRPQHFFNKQPVEKVDFASTASYVFPEEFDASMCHLWAFFNGAFFNGLLGEYRS
jgi:hypothetical protein